MCSSNILPAVKKHDYMLHRFSFVCLVHLSSLSRALGVSNWGARFIKFCTNFLNKALDNGSQHVHLRYLQVVSDDSSHVPNAGELRNCWAVLVVFHWLRSVLSCRKRMMIRRLWICLEFWGSAHEQ